MPSKFCEIKGFEPGQKTTEALDRLEKNLNLTKALESLSIFGVLYNIFAGKSSKVPSASTQAINIKLYDWELFHDAMKGINAAKRHSAELIIVGAMMDTSGREQDFWRCMYNTLQN